MAAPYPLRARRARRASGGRSSCRGRVQGRGCTASASRARGRSARCQRGAEREGPPRRPSAPRAAPAGHGEVGERVRGRDRDPDERKVGVAVGHRLEARLDHPRHRQRRRPGTRATGGEIRGERRSRSASAETARAARKRGQRSRPARSPARDAGRSTESVGQKIFRGRRPGDRRVPERGPRAGTRSCERRRPDPARGRSAPPRARRAARGSFSATRQRRATATARRPRRRLVEAPERPPVEQQQDRGEDDRGRLGHQGAGAGGATAKGAQTPAARRSRWARA